MPGPTTIYHLWKSFDINSNGACGENCGFGREITESSLSLLHRILSIRCRISWINLCTSGLFFDFFFVFVLGAD